jgi:formate dehydrogenase subunit gamma
VRIDPPAPGPAPGTAAATSGGRPGPQTGAGQAAPGTAPSEPPLPAFTARGAQDAAELELQRALRGGVIEGQVSIPDGKLAVLVQPDGRDWRVFRNQRMTWIGLGLIALAVVVLAALYLIRGPTPIEAGRSGRTVQRYSLLERVNHWMVAASFVLLALTGLNITFGAYALRPVIGAQAFTDLTWWGQAVHHYLAFPFTLGLLVMLVVWLRDNLPSRTDLAWLKAGGPLAKGHPPAGRFNAGQKGLYWLTVGGGLVIAVSGFLLMFPFEVTDVTGQQWAHIVHGIGAMLLIALIIGHIYLGSLGTEGALEQMTTGRADWNYLREHHSVWLQDEVARARRVAGDGAADDGRRVVGAD